MRPYGLASSGQTTWSSDFGWLAIFSQMRWPASKPKLLPDVIVAEISMPGCSGIQAAARLHELGIVSRVASLTQNSEVAYARQAMGTEALGYVLKSATSSELITAIREPLRRPGPSQFAGRANSEQSVPCPDSKACLARYQELETRL